MKNIIFETEDKAYRIVEHVDCDADMEDLKGDSYNPKHVDHISPEELRKEELEFERTVESNGVYGYVLEKWNPLPGQGYEHIDSCWGFVGSYVEGDATYGHYIVDEMKQTIKDGAK